MKRLALVLMMLALPAMACGLSDSTPPTLVPPPPELGSPMLGLNPISGAPGTIVNVGAAGFPVGAKVNLYLAPVNGANPNPVAQNLTIGTGGILSFALQLPDSINGTALTSSGDLTFTLSTTDGLSKANAIFIAQIGGAGTPTATAAAGTDNTNSGGSTSTLFITSPNISATIIGAGVVVTGSGASFNNTVGVQVLDANYNLLGSALATVQAGTGAVGPWETTVSFPQPGAAAPGYIVAYTVNASGGVSQQASIPITLAGNGAPTIGPLTPTTIPATVPPVITGAAPTSAAPTGSFVTATPHS
jgi:Immunoglobulin-like domain of bacterial spore germination